MHSRLYPVFIAWKCFLQEILNQIAYLINFDSEHLRKMDTFVVSFDQFQQGKQQLQKYLVVFLFHYILEVFQCCSVWYTWQLSLAIHCQHLQLVDCPALFYHLFCIIFFTLSFLSHCLTKIQSIIRIVMSIEYHRTNIDLFFNRCLSISKRTLRLNLCFWVGIISTLVLQQRV